MLIDTHSHINFNAYQNDAEYVIQNALDNNIWLINVGTNYKTSKKAVEISQKYEKGVWATIGLHPIHLETGLVKIKNDTEEIEVNTREEEFDYEKYKRLAQSKKVVAIGEIGLDYYWKPKTKEKLVKFKEKQKEVLLKQINLAQELNLPIIFHCRFGHDDLIAILKNLHYHSGVIHCFTGTKEQLKEYLKMGFFIGFNGIIFKKIEGTDFNENIRTVPLERILIETDCPYLAPPEWGKERNEPVAVKYIAKKIADIKNINFEKVAEITTQNAQELFQIK